MTDSYLLLLKSVKRASRAWYYRWSALPIQCAASWDYRYLSHPSLHLVLFVGTEAPAPEILDGTRLSNPIWLPPAHASILTLIGSWSSPAFAGLSSGEGSKWGTEQWDADITASMANCSTNFAVSFILRLRSNFSSTCLIVSLAIA